MELKPELGIDYHINDYGERGELTSTVFHGLLGGVAYLESKGYEIIYGSASVAGLMYIVPFLKNKKKSPQENNQIEMLKETIEGLEEELDEIKESSEKEINDLKIENRTLKSQLTKIKNKVEKLESK